MKYEDITIGESLNEKHIYIEDETEQSILVDISFQDQWDVDTKIHVLEQVIKFLKQTKLS